MDPGSRHSGFEGNEQADTLAKKGINYMATWEAAIRDRTKHKIWSKWRDASSFHFTREEQDLQVDS